MFSTFALHSKAVESLIIAQYHHSTSKSCLNLSSVIKTLGPHAKTVCKKPKYPGVFALLQTIFTHWPGGHLALYRIKELRGEGNGVEKGLGVLSSSILSTHPSNMLQSQNIQNFFIKRIYWLWNSSEPSCSQLLRSYCRCFSWNCILGTSSRMWGGNIVLSLFGPCTYLPAMMLQPLHTLLTPLSHYILINSIQRDYKNII